MNSDRKERIRHELIQYGVNVIYLTLVFAAFTHYRRLILAAHDIAYAEYGFALIKAVVLGKVIMLGGMFHLGRGLESKPLIYPAIYKTFVFTLLVAAFTLVEHVIKALLHGETFSMGLFELSENGLYILIANSLVVFVALLPFFLVKELGRVLGATKLRSLLFRQRLEP